MTHMYSLKMLELGMHVFPEPGSSLQALGEGPSWNFWLLVATASPRCAWLVAASLHSLPASSHSHLPYILQVPLCKLILRTLGITFGAQPHNRESLCVSQPFIPAVGPAV